MRKRTTLNWWLSFAQADIERMYNKTKLRLLTDLSRRVNPDCEWHATHLRIDDIKEYQKGAQVVVNWLNNPNLPRPEGKILKVRKMEGLTSAPFVDTEYDKVSTGTFLMLEALELAGIESAEELGHCKHCNKIFLQVSPKRKKLFCSTRCRSDRRKQDAQERHT